MRNRTRERKQPGGIALSPSLWQRIAERADAEDKSRSQVVEEALQFAFFAGHGSRKSDGESYNAEPAPTRRYVDVPFDDDLD